MNETTDPAQLGTDDAAVEAHELAQAGQGFSPGEQRQMVEWELEAGRLTREEADAMLRDNGLDPLDAESEAEPASVKAEIDSAFPPASAEEFNLPALVDDTTPYTPEVAEHDNLRRQWLVDARLPKGIGESMMRAAYQGAKVYATLDEDGRELVHRAERAKIEQHFGEETESALYLANQLAAEVEEAHPGFQRWVDETGAANNAYFIIQWALQAQRLYDRKVAA